MAAEPLFTFSEGPRVMLCAASAALPQALEAESYDATRGKAIHAFLRDVQGGIELAEALARAPAQHRIACQSIDLSRVPAGLQGYAAERAFAYQPANDTARVLGDDLAREYAPLLQPGELPGAVDVIALEGADGVFVLDYKTGRGRVPAAAVNWQLRLGALAACRAYGRARATVAICFVHEDGEPFFDVASYDAFDLDTFASEVRRQALEIIPAKRKLVALNVQPDVAEGDHCRYCKAFRSCPAKLSLALQLAADAESAIAGKPTSFEQWIVEGMTGEGAALAWRRLKAIEAVTKRVRELLFGFAARQPVDIGDGYMLGEVEGSAMEVVHADRARDALIELFALDEKIADAVVEHSTTLARIELVIKPLVFARGGKWSQWEQKIRALLLARGAAVEKTRHTVKEYSLEAAEKKRKAAEKRAQKEAKAREPDALLPPGADIF